MRNITLAKTIKLLSLILLATTALFLCFFNLSKNQVQQWDEQTNINVVNETLAVLDSRLRGNDKGEGGNDKGRVTFLTKDGLMGVFVLQYQNRPFLEKPPLWYWTTMSVVKISKNDVLPVNYTHGKLTNDDIFNYRLVSATSGFLLIVLIYHIGKKLWGHWGGIASGATLLATQHLFINNVSGYFSTHTFRSADLDAMQILFMMLSFWFFWKATISHLTSPYQGEEKALIHNGENEPILFRFNKSGLRWVYLILATAFSALAVMTKGPFGVFPIFIWGLFKISQLLITIPTCLHSRLDTWRVLKSFGIVLLTFLVVTVPWHLFMYFKFGQEFINVFFIYHAVKRVTETLEEHHESWNFYAWMLFHPEVFAPTILLPISMFGMIKKERILSNFKYFASVFGVLLHLLVFTLIQTKLSWYNLYVYPFAALCIGYLFSEILKIKNYKLRVSIIILFFAILQVGIIYNVSWVLTL